MHDKLWKKIWFQKWTPKAESESDLCKRAVNQDQYRAFNHDCRQLLADKWYKCILIEFFRYDVDSPKQSLSSHVSLKPPLDMKIKQII